MPDATFWPTSVMGWAGLTLSVSCMVMLLWRLSKNPLIERMNEIERRVQLGMKGSRDVTRGVESRTHHLEVGLKEQEDATLAIVSYLIERDGREAAEALLPGPKDQNGKPVPVVTRFDTGVMYNRIPDGWVERDIPRPAVCPPDQSPPEADPEEEEPQVTILRHQRELDEWDAALMRQMLGDE